MLISNDVAGGLVQSEKPAEKLSGLTLVEELASKGKVNRDPHQGCPCRMQGFRSRSVQSETEIRSATTAYQGGGQQRAKLLIAGVS